MPKTGFSSRKTQQCRNKAFPRSGISFLHIQFSAKFHFSLFLQRNFRSPERFFLFPIPVHQADNVQKQVDKIEIQLQR